MPYENPAPGSHEIPLELAVEMTARYRDNLDKILEYQYRDQGILAICETFDISVLKGLESIEGATAFRIYYGMSEDLKVHAILVAVDADGKDILPQNNMGYIGGGDGTIYEEGLRCPTYCPPESPLNGG